MNLFGKLATKMNHDRVDGGVKIVKLAGLLQYYLAAFYKADTVLMARMGHEEMQMDHPSILNLVAVAAEYQFRRNQVYKGFWDALHNDLFAGSCPSCTPTAYGWCPRYPCHWHIMANHRPNSPGCRETDAVAEAYAMVKQLWSATPAISTLAKEMPMSDLSSWKRSRWSSSDTFCGIYKTWANNQLNCWRSHGTQEQHYTSHSFVKKFRCHSSYIPGGPGSRRHRGGW